MKFNKDDLDFDLLGLAAAHLLSRMSRQRIEFKPRWITAVAKGVTELTQNDFWYFDGQELYIFSATKAGVMYAATSENCQCLAFQRGFPCYHRAAAILICSLIEKAENEKKEQILADANDTPDADEHGIVERQASRVVFKSFNCNFLMSR